MGKESNHSLSTLKRISELEKRILKYQKSYYTGNGDVIPDAEFDEMWDELAELDPSNIIFTKVGSDIEESYKDSPLNTGNFKKVQHIIPMGSQAKAAGPENFRAWANKMPFDEFLVEYKLDGASIELQYQDGVFVKAITRGDGKIGDDITSNVTKMSGFSKQLSLPFTGGVRGEVIMPHDIHDTFFSDKANCRNAANGLMKRKDGVGSEYLKVICYDVWLKNSAQTQDNTDTVFFADEEQKIKWLTHENFETVKLKICHGAQEVIDYRAQVMELRDTLNYDIDGLVIKGRALDFKDASRARPEKQIAFKFSLEEAVSVLRDVEWSENGATYTPVAIFDPVQLNGTTVQRASLANPDTMRALNVKIGNHIVITKRGEIIPKVETVVKTNTHTVLSEIAFPKVCSTCNTRLIDDGTRLFCPNSLCPKRIHHRIEKWVSVLDIRDFGLTLIRRLYEMNRIKSIYDIYTLTKNEISNLAGLGEKSADKIINSIQGRRSVTLEQFIAGFDIEGIGLTLAEKLIEAGFTTLQKILDATVDDLASINGFGNITAKTLVDGLKENHSEMLRLINEDIIRIISRKSDGILEGLSFCFTGELVNFKRSEAQELVKSLGGSVKTTVVKGLSYLVTNTPESGTSKNIKARQLSVRVITEKEFLALTKK
ncbi:MAG: DNA ligase (NAD(+)) LigA [Treponema sp. CETP13]|nr:MAG: DNA ligase (NAD(+)) LigA [Treponema sp. CETP13]